MLRSHDSLRIVSSDRSVDANVQISPDNTSTSGKVIFSLPSKSYAQPILYNTSIDSTWSHIYMIRAYQPILIFYLNCFANSTNVSSFGLNVILSTFFANALLAV